MFYKSKITGNVYKFENDIYTLIIQDDNNILYQGQLQWLKDGNSIEAFDGLPEEIAEANKPIVPDKVTAIQFIAQLSFEGISEANIMAVIDTLNEPDRTVAKVSYNRAVYFERTNPFISLIGQAFNKSEDDLDNIFINASNIQ